MSTLTSDMDCEPIFNSELRLGAILRAISNNYEIEADLPSVTDMEVDQIGYVNEVGNQVEPNEKVDEVFSNKNEDVEDV